jgi:translation initiation factor IF-3
LVGRDGQQIGIVPLREALNAAREQRLDLVEVAPHATPPVCRIMDHGKFIYERAKRERDARKAQKTVEVKEIRIRPKTDDYHRGFKVKRARKWLQDGAKVKVRILFRGREITHAEIGRQILDEVFTELSDIAQVEQNPSMEGRTMLLVLGPRTEEKKK